MARKILCKLRKENTTCIRSSDPFYIVNYDIKWVTPSCTHSIVCTRLSLKQQTGLRVCN